MKRGYWVAGVLVIVVVILLFVYIPTGNVVDEMELGYIDVDVTEARVIINMNPEIIIIDVSPKYDMGHLPGAVNYYVGDGSLDAAIPMLDLNVMYLVYCHFESASRNGAQKLVDAGFTNVYRLRGDFGAWVDAGYVVEY